MSLGVCGLINVGLVSPRPHSEMPQSAVNFYSTAQRSRMSDVLFAPSPVQRKSMDGMASSVRE